MKRILIYTLTRLFQKDLMAHLRIESGFNMVITCSSHTSNSMGKSAASANTGIFLSAQEQNRKLRIPAHPSVSGIRLLHQFKQRQISVSRERKAAQDGFLVSAHHIRVGTSPRKTDI